MRDDECPEFERWDGSSRAGAVYKGAFVAATGEQLR
jgi:hypothetical protein